ncbi:hypothetical protein [Cohnella sp. GCM10027633]|uniref:hypothetical protein n=1 Tax=unclassified Cohnella TaxID=2636738 RepID=UPI0036305515
MIRSISICLFVIIMLILQSCSGDINKSFEGTWIANQESQKISGNSDGKHTKYRVLEYNYWESKNEKIKLSNYTQISRSGKEEIDHSGIEVKYEMKSKNEIIIDNIVFRLEINKDKMIIKNDDLEIQFERYNNK